MIENWLSLTILHPPLTGEAVSAALFEEGALSLWEDQPDPQGRAVLRAGFAPTDEVRLRQNLPYILARLATAFELSPSAFETTFALETNHDWAEKWKEDLRPVPVGQRLLIAPTWWPSEDLPDPRSAAILRLDPGMAFGTGRHASTFLCLLAMSEFLTAPPRRVLDVGAGSGILSLAAKLLYPQAQVTGVDNDPDTIAVAQANADANHIDGVAFSTASLLTLHPGFDLLLANITLNTLLELAGDLAVAAAPGAVLILSGLLDSQAEEAAEAYQRRDFTLIRRLAREEWAALILQHHPPSAGPGQ